MSPHALVIGGGAAGLTAALRLAQQGYRITIVERAERLGGRLATPDSFAAGPALPVVLMGWHQATLGLLADLGTRKKVRFGHSPGLELRLRSGRLVTWPSPPLPATSRLVLALMMFGGLSFRDRWRFVTWIERTWENDPAIPADLGTHSAEAWLRSIGQSETARTEVWTPVSEFFLGDDLATVSASGLLAALLAAFFSKRRHGHLAIPREGLDQLLIEPLQAELIRRGVTIALGRPLAAISCDAHRVTGVALQDGNRMIADWYVAAVPRHDLTPLLPERALTRFSYFHQLDQLVDSPALVVELKIGQAMPASRLILLADRSFDWLVAKPDARSGVVSLVATGKPECLDWCDEEIMNRATADLHAAMPTMRDKPIQQRRLLRVPRAFLSLRPGTQAFRPLQQSPFPNLLLAGDWTDTGLPSTLDGAILSGDLCAKAISGKQTRSA